MNLNNLIAPSDEQSQFGRILQIVSKNDAIGFGTHYYPGDNRITELAVWSNAPCVRLKIVADELKNYGYTPLDFLFAREQVSSRKNTDSYKPLLIYALKDDTFVTVGTIFGHPEDD